MTERQKILTKIKKCMALSASANEHEAAAALRQARKLMEAYQVSEQEVEAQGVTEAAAASPSLAAEPTRWESSLASRVAKAFACAIIFSPGVSGANQRAAWIFVGSGASSEVAQYACQVLLRQVHRARATYIKTHLRRFKLANKRRMADLYCEGWVNAVVGTILAFAGTPEQQSAIDAHLALKTGLGITKPRSLKVDHKFSLRDMDSYNHGLREGQRAQLHHGVPGTAERAAIAER